MLVQCIVRHVRNGRWIGRTDNGSVDGQLRIELFALFCLCKIINRTLNDGIEENLDLFPTRIDGYAE